MLPLDPRLATQLKTLHTVAFGSTARSSGNHTTVAILPTGFGKTDIALACPRVLDALYARDLPRRTYIVTPLALFVLFVFHART